MMPTRRARKTRSPSPRLYKEEQGSDIYVDPEVSEEPKAKKRKFLILTEEQERKIAEWYRDNPMLYNKGLRDYKLTDRKDKMYADKAKEIGIEVAEFRNWLKSMRTRYGRLKDHPSGPGTKDLSERDQWIRETFSFLYNHIVRIQARKSIMGKGSHFEAQLEGETEAGVESCMEEEEEEDEEVHHPSTLIPIPSTSTSTTALRKCKGNGKRKKVATLTPEYMDLLARAEISRRLEMNTAELVAADSAVAVNPRTQWGRYMTSELSTIHDSLWEQYQREAYDLLKSYHRESDTIRHKETQVIVSINGSTTSIKCDETSD